MDTITSITKTCESVPEQYEGTLKSGKRFYMRCRFGYGELRVGTQEQWDNWTMPTVADITYAGEEFQGKFNDGDKNKLFVRAGIDPFLHGIEVKDACFQRMNALMDKMMSPSQGGGPVMLTVDDDVLHAYAGNSAKMAELLAQFDKLK